MFWYSGLASTASRTLASGAWRRISSSQPALVSSIAAHSSPRGVDAGRRRTPSAGTRVAVLPSAPTPSASASRRAGSTVSTSTLPPWSTAAASPSAAAIVVLPTPPDPQHEHHLLAGQQRVERARELDRAPSRLASSSRRDVQLLGERLGDEGDDAPAGRPGEQLGHVEDRQAGRDGRRAAARGGRLPTRRRASVIWAASTTSRTPGPAASTSSGSASSRRSTTSAALRSNSAGRTRLATIAAGGDAGLGGRAGRAGRSSR